LLEFSTLPASVGPNTIPFTIRVYIGDVLSLTVPGFNAIHTVGKDAPACAINSISANALQTGTTVPRLTSSTTFPSPEWTVDQPDCGYLKYTIKMESMPVGITADEALPFFVVTHEEGFLRVIASPSETAPILTYWIVLVGTLSTDPNLFERRGYRLLSLHVQYFYHLMP